MTLLKGSDTNSREINVALLSLEADIKNKITNFDTSVIDKQLAEINSRIDKINAGGNNTSAEINDIRYEIEDINSKLNGNSVKIENIEQKLSDIFSAENKVTDFNTTKDSGIYYWVTDAANRPTDYGVLLVNKYDGGDSATSLWVNQVAYGTDNKIYFRQNINSGNWTEWKAVAFDGELTAYKVANALTVNGKTYDGSEAVDAGVQKIENGGTGVTTQADINKAFIGNLEEGVSDVTDGTEFVSSYASDNGFAETAEGALNKPYKRQFIKVWNYIKGKISSVLGLSTDGLSLNGNITTLDNKYIRAICASNDYVQIMGSGTGDSGSGEISTGDNGNEPLYARQRDTSNNVTHEVTLLDASGNQKFNTVTANGFIGNLSGKAATAGTADKATSDANGNNIVNTYATKTELEKTTTKGVSLSTVTTRTTKYIKLGTFHWYDSFSFKCRIAGNSFEDDININILGGIANASSVCGYYSTNSRLTKSIIVKRGEAWSSNFEIYLKIEQLTTDEVYVTIDKNIQDRINISESTTAPSGTLEEIAFNNFNGMFSGNIDALCIKANNKMVIPIGAPSSLEDGCIWIER